MVYVNSKKFACESCIKGHRSSSCHHTDRPLFEIKKKGRPVSQCEKCRQLRQSKRVHSKCTCLEKEDVTTVTEPSMASSSKSSLTPTNRPRRFIPIVPALPNGLKDVLGSSSTLPADSRQRVDSLLNPCPCKSLWKCKCKSSTSNRRSPPLPDKSPVERSLVMLAQAASSMRSGNSLPSPAFHQPPDRPKRTYTPPGDSHIITPSKRPKLVPPSFQLGPELPPLLYGSDRSPLHTCEVPIPNTMQSHSPMMLMMAPVPTFAVMMPPMSAITSIAGSGCVCGVECACPGCVEHRGPEHVMQGRDDCTEGCGACIDRSSDDFELSPGHRIGSSTSSSSGGGGGGGGSSVTTSSVLDRFFARAAALPTPPSLRRMGAGMSLDPMNVIVYPETAREPRERGMAFGLVNLPKLECCGGNCSCPSGGCTCGKSCGGCCSEEISGGGGGGGGDTPTQSTEVEGRQGSERVSLPSCCAAKLLKNTGVAV